MAPKAEKAPEQEVAVFIIPELTAEVREVLAEEIADNGDIEISMPTLKIPSGGGLAFTLPNDEADVAKYVDVVIVDRFPVNVFWEGSFEGGNNPPDCVANDGVCGVGYPGGPCAACPNNAFGSADKGAGKACKNVVRAYILPSGGALLPWKLDVPPTSIKEFKKYVSGVVMGGKHPYGVVTRIGLEKKKSGDGIDYSALTFKTITPLPAEQVAMSKNYVQGVKMITRMETKQPALGAPTRAALDVGHTVTDEEDDSQI